MTGSMFEWWFGVRMKGPEAGSFSRFRIRMVAIDRMNGTTGAASSQSTEGLRFSANGFAGRVRTVASAGSAAPGSAIGCDRQLSTVKRAPSAVSLSPKFS